MTQLSLRNSCYVAQMFQCGWKQGVYSCDVMLIVIQGQIQGLPLVVFFHSIGLHVMMVFSLLVSSVGNL